MTTDLDTRVAGLIADLSGSERIAILVHDWTPLTRRGLPFLHYVDAGSGLRDVPGATAFPTGIALAATFDADLAERYGRAVGEEVRTAGFSVLLGPTLDLARDPRGGRVPEALGEDPYLSGLIGAAHVRGVQSNHVIAMLKHYTAYNAESRRTGWGPRERRGPASDVRVSAAALHDAHLVPFEAAVEAGVWSMMTSYNRVNDGYPAQSRDLLDLPRHTWGWRGFYAPDFLFAVRDARGTLAAGLDVPGLQETCGRTAEVVEELPASERDLLVTRILWALVGAGLVDHPLPEPSMPSTPAHRALAREAAVGATVLLRNEREALPFGDDVRTLAVVGPAGPDAMFTLGGSAAVAIDPERAVTPLAGILARAGAARRVVAAQGSWGDAPLSTVPATAFTRPDGGPGVRVRHRHADGTTTTAIRATIDETVTPDWLTTDWPGHWSALLTSGRSGPHRLCLEVGGFAVVRIAGDVVMAGVREAGLFLDGPRSTLQCVVHLEAGIPAPIEIDYELASGLVIPPKGILPALRLGWQPPDHLLDEAVAAAASADAAVVLVNAASSEGMDRTGLELPGDQDELVARVAAANPRTVVVLNTPGPVLLPWLDDVAAVLAVWYPGERFGDASADVLFGDAEPGGRLPITFPRDRAQLPGGDQTPLEVPETLEYSEGVRIGYRSTGLLPDGPLLPFGHGLGWSRAAHEVTGAEVVDGQLRLDLAVTNPGPRATSHVVQVYVELEGRDDGPALAAVQRIAVDAAGETRTRLTVEAGAFVRYDVAIGRRRIVPGTHRLRLAGDATDAGHQLVVEVGAEGPLTV